MNKSMITICFAMCGAIALADTARIGAYVIDAVTQKPVPGIKVSASFSNDNGWKAWTESAPRRSCWIIGRLMHITFCRKRRIRAITTGADITSSALA